MKIVTRRDPLQQAIATAARAVSNRSTLPILSHILLVAEDERLTVSATDLEIGVRVELQVEVEEAGRTTLPSRLLSEVVSAQSSGRRSICDGEHDHATFRSGKSVMDVHGLPAEAFSACGRQRWHPPAGAAGGAEAMIQQCILAVSRMKRGPGDRMMVKIGEGRMRSSWATDTHRLATAARSCRSRPRISQ